MVTFKSKRKIFDGELKIKLNGKRLDWIGCSEFSLLWLEYSTSTVNAKPATLNSKIWLKETWFG